MPTANLPKCPCENGHGSFFFSVGMAKFAVGIGEVPTADFTMHFKIYVPCPQTTLPCPQKTLPKCPPVNFSVGMEKFYVGQGRQQQQQHPPLKCGMLAQHVGPTSTPQAWTLAPQHPRCWPNIHPSSMDVDVGPNPLKRPEWA